MKTEKELTELKESAKQDMINALPDFTKAVQDNDWQLVVEYANGFIVGACTINAAEGFLQ